jgi:alanine-glyoxylate transaminase/serine-glyoxylate transaminase/serine-pyruvate transaminase
VRKKLLTDFDIEIGAGLGPLKGQIWRVGLMGETSTLDNVQTFLSALDQSFRHAGRRTDRVTAQTVAH